MRILLAAIAATMFSAAVTPAVASGAPKATIVLNDGRMFHINFRCHHVLVGGSAYCINRVLRK